VTTASYEVHFADRWIRDETRVTDGARAAPTSWTATRTSSLQQLHTLREHLQQREGAFIVNREGRCALCAATSGQQRADDLQDPRILPTREDILTVLRVHPIPGSWTSGLLPAASGMTFRDDLIQPSDRRRQHRCGFAGSIHLGDGLRRTRTLAFTMEIDTDIPASTTRATTSMIRRRRDAVHGDAFATDRVVSGKTTRSPTPILR